MLILSDDIGISAGLTIGGSGISFPNDDGYSDPVMTTALTTPANSQSSVIFNADGTEVVGAELQTNAGMTGTTGTTGGGGTFPTPVVATGWYVQAASGTTATATKDASDDQVLSSAVGTSYLLDNANTVSFVAGQFYKGEVLVDKVVGTCQITVIKNDGTNVQATAFTATMGVNRFWFKAASTATGTIRINVPANGSIVIRTASIKQVTYPLNCLRANINTGAGTASLVQRVAGVETSLISAAVPVMNKNYAPVGCCTDPDWDLDRYDGYNGAGAWADGSGWSAANSSVLSSEDNGSTGNCLRITANNADSPRAQKASIAVRAGEIWNLKVRIKAGTENTYLIRILDNRNAQYLYTSGSVDASADWSTSIDQTFTIPSGCTTVGLQLHSQNGITGYTDFDDISFTKTSTDDLTVVVDKATDGLSSSVSLFHDGVQVGSSQTIDNTGGKDVILASKNHYLSGDFGSSLLKKRRFALGSELVVNGGFDADLSQWTLDNSGTTTVWEWSEGTAKVVTTAGVKWKNLQKMGLLTVGRHYRIALTVAGASAAGDLVLYVDPAGKNIGANGAISAVSVALNTYFIFYSTKVNLSIDDISCKEVILP